MPFPTPRSRPRTRRFAALGYVSRCAPLGTHTPPQRSGARNASAGVKKLRREAACYNRKYENREFLHLHRPRPDQHRQVGAGGFVFADIGWNTNDWSHPFHAIDGQATAGDDGAVVIALSGED